MEPLKTKHICISRFSNNNKIAQETSNQVLPQSKCRPLTLYQPVKLRRFMVASPSSMAVSGLSINGLGIPNWLRKYYNRKC